MDLKNSVLLIGGCAAWLTTMHLPATYADGEGFLKGFGAAIIVTSFYNIITWFIKLKKKTHEITTR